MGTMGKQKTYTGKKEYLQMLINAMQDSVDLATEHHLEGELHYGPQLQKIVDLLESYLQNSWYKLITAESVAKPGRWLRMIIFLEAELSIVQTRAFECESDLDPKDDQGDKLGKGNPKKPSGGFAGYTDIKEECHYCGDRHPSSNKGHLSCKKFLTMTRKERWSHIMQKKHCLQCLDGRTRWNDPNHKCSADWICPNEAHAKFDKKLHFMICQFHVEDEQNKQLFEEFKNEVLKAEWQKKIFKDQSYITRNDSTFINKEKLAPEIVPPGDSTLPDASTYGSPVFLLQPVPFNGHVFNFMYDSGCQTFVCRKAAIDALPDSCRMNVIKGPIILRGVGGAVVTSPYGHFTVNLPIHDGRLGTFSGLCLDVITGAMPPYPVREARKSLIEAYTAQGGKEQDLPQVPLLVGGDTDFLFGSQYNWYQPRLLFILTTGLAIYESIFTGVDGTRGCIGGNHHIFTQCEQQFLETHTIAEFRLFLAQQIQLYNTGIRICLDHDSLSVDNTYPHRLAIVDQESDTRVLEVVLSCVVCKSKDLINAADSAGSVIEYRCVKCRGCNDCKNGELIEKTSLIEEYEQHVINESVTVDFENQRVEAVLPFIADPITKLASNEKNADKIYSQQVNKLSKLPPSVKEAVLESEKKLQDSGHVEWVKDLTPFELDILNRHESKYFMPWRFVHNENSTTTPTRIVFDASSISESGYSLNELLAKGINSLNSLLEIFIRFRLHVVALHTDIKKMYNVIKLKPEHWTYQRYKWQKKLDPKIPSKVKVIKTAIYGVKPSGNQAQVGLRETARRQQIEFPEAANAIINDTYVDDCATGVSNHPVEQAADKLAADIDTVLGKSGFVTKGYTVSGKPPLPALSKDGKSINILGGKWAPELDTLQLSIGPLNFGKKVRGKKDTSKDCWKIPDELTKRICCGKVGEVFDLSGFVAPLIAGFKLDVREMIKAHYGWDDVISNTHREMWIKNFEIMVSIGELEYRRAIVPEDAASMDVELISAGDASEKLICAGSYIRFKLKDDTYSCQLVLGKTKIVPEDMTLPRAELFASTLNVHVMEIVKRSITNKCLDSLLVTDSEIALYWSTSQTKRQKPWVRNRVIEINRFSVPDDWYHVPSQMNPADIGTRKGATIEDVNQASEWINGKPWMKLPFNELRESHLRNVEQIKYENEQMEVIEKELMGPVVNLCCSNFEQLLAPEHQLCFIAGGSKCFVGSDADISVKVSERLTFSQYLIDPNKYRFHKVVRIMAIVLKVAKIWLERLVQRLGRNPKKSARHSHAVNSDELVVNRSALVTLKCVDDEAVPDDHVAMLSDAEVQCALNYFFQKATEEVKHFMNPKYYENVSVEKNNIMYYNARVSPCDVTFKCTMTDVMIDLSTGTFVVPLVDRHSPLAYAIVNQIHWYHPTVSHGGVETIIRQLMTVAHIFGVRDLVKLFRKQCARCRYLLKITVDVEMSPASGHQICVAPAFYVTQTDLCGPFTSYSKHNKRTTLKIWIAVFVCTATSMTCLRVMEGYDTTQFVMAFSRFGSSEGFPKKLLVDAGSQILSACEGMKLNMCDITGALNQEYGIEFDTCPVGGHNFHGKVERKIKVVKESICKAAHLQRPSSLQWETICAEIGNSINNHPVAIGNETEDLESLDLITPNRLRIARNNERSPVGSLDVTDKFDRILKMNSDVFNVWWETWLVSALPKLVPKPKWYKNDEHLKVGDIVLFNKVVGSLIAGAYQYGVVEEVHMSADGHIRSVTIRYRNSTEAVNRTTTRAVRSLVVIHRIDELDIMEELGKASFIHSK